MHDNVMNSAIAQRVQKLRLAAGLSVDDLAERACVDASMLLGFENGSHDIKLSSLERVLTVLRVGLDLTNDPAAAPAEVTYVNDWHGFVEQSRERLAQEMREARSVDENLRNACFIDGRRIKVLSWGDM